MNKGTRKFFILSTLLITIGCKPKTDQQSVKGMSTLLQDSSAKQSDSEKDINVTNLTNQILKRDSLEIENDFDFQFKSTTLIHYDKNQVEWKSEEKNEFRFVYKKKNHKLIVYRNNIEFKIYHKPRIFADHYKYKSESWYKELTMIYVNEKSILNLGYLDNLEYSPNGFENHSDYYILIPIAQAPILEEVLNKIN
jgi:hypothetical protein